MVPIFTSGIYSVSEHTRQITINISHGIQLRGDILVICYHKDEDNEQPNRKVMFRCQFHTCAIYNDVLDINKQELDEACYGK